MHAYVLVHVLLVHMFPEYSIKKHNGECLNKILMNTSTVEPTQVLQTKEMYNNMTDIPSLNEVVDGCVELLLPHQEVSPLLLQPHHLLGEGIARQLHRCKEQEDLTYTVHLHTPVHLHQLTSGAQSTRRLSHT